MTTDTLPVLATRRQAAEYLGISERQLDAWIVAGVIKKTCLGRLVRVHRDELDRVAREGVGRSRSSL